MDLIKFGPSSFMINIILDIQYIVQIVSKSNEEGLGLQAKENVVSMYFCMYTNWCISIMKYFFAIKWKSR